jgi:hypothetical protein
VVAFFFVFKGLGDCTYVPVVALALQRVDNTELFNILGPECTGFTGNPDKLQIQQVC